MFGSEIYGKYSVHSSQKHDSGLVNICSYNGEVFASAHPSAPMEPVFQPLHVEEAVVITCKENETFTANVLVQNYMYNKEALGQVNDATGGLLLNIFKQF